MREPALLGGLFTVFVTSVLCAPLITFCPVLVKEVFEGGVGHFSLKMGAFGAGGLLGVIGLLALSPGRDRRPISSWLAASYGVIMMLAALNHWPWGLPVLFVLAGVAMTASNTSVNTLLQSIAPARLRGQAISLFMLAMRGGMSLGSLLAGVSVNLLGVREALFINGFLTVLAHLALGQVWRRASLPR